MTPLPDRIDFDAMDDAGFQHWMLQGVSRTFALTIPQLPDGLHAVVANAYLLCRIADTIEDDPALDAQQTQAFSERWIHELADKGDGVEFAADLCGLLSDAMLPEERVLIAETPRVLAITRGFNSVQREALARCVAIMSRGMARFQKSASLVGLADIQEHNDYCYFVAGVVGECLTTLFVDYLSTQKSGEQDQERMMSLALSFGQGLQMTNILKDIWDDRARGVCWLPRSVFAGHGFDVSDLDPAHVDPGFEAGLGDLIALARGHLENALEYTLMIPPQEKGIRNFCLWAIGMAMLTLRKINAHRDFRAGQDVKISRSSVRVTILLSRMCASSNGSLRFLFKRLAASLPAKPAGGVSLKAPRIDFSGGTPEPC